MSTPEKVPLAQQRIARYLCEDAMRGTGCPHHERIAQRLHDIVLRAQEEERSKDIDGAFERIAGFVKALETHGFVGPKEQP